jgi:hypothetical protein
MQAVSTQDADKASEEMDSLEESLKVSEDYLK